PVLVFGVLSLGMVAAIIYVYEGQRRIPVQYARRLRGNRWYGGGSTHIPMRVNSAGMIPLIFASSIVLSPGLVASYFVNVNNDVISGIAQGLYYALYLERSVWFWGL